MTGTPLQSSSRNPTPSRSHVARAEADQIRSVKRGAIGWIVGRDPVAVNAPADGALR
jgi:hypothetical protein